MSTTEGIRKYREISKRTRSTPKKTKPEATKKVKAAKAVTKAVAKAKKKPAKQAKVAKKTKTVKSTKTKISAKAAKKAVEKVAEVKELIRKEEEAKANAEAGVRKERTSSLVKEDFTPANTPRERLILEYSPLIKYIAQRIAARLPANIELDDLISSGVIGLMDAIDKYDCNRDNKFKTYAEFRIRGAILDELRAQDWVPRSVREKAKQLERAFSKLEQALGRQANDDEVCAELQMTREEYHDMLNQVRSVSLLSFDDLSNLSKADKRTLHEMGDTGNKVQTPFNEVNVASLKKMIADAIRDLPEKQRLVLSLYYYEDLNLKEIGRVLDVTESRVSQLHTQAVLRLKGRLRSHWDEFVALVG